MASTPGSASTTPGKFITSASPSTQGLAWKRGEVDRVERGARGLHAVAGTQEGAITNIESGEPLALSSMKRMPSRPSTLAISCGSVTTVVVPRGTTARANSDGRHHGALDVDVGVEQAGREIGAAEVERLARGVAGADADDDAARERDLGRIDLAGEHVDQLQVGEQEVGRLAAGRLADQGLELHGALPRRV